MNRSFIVALLTVTMVSLMSTAGYAFVEPHYFACDNCHSRHTGNTSLAAVNGCVACHATNGVAGRMPIDRGDMSNYFGNATSYHQPAVGSKSTHNYLATLPYDARAMVTDSTNSTLNSSYNTTTAPVIGTTYCIRCHNAKNNSNRGTATFPFLRIANTNNALCIQCHASRNTVVSTSGSHPVFSKAYSTAYKNYSIAFRRVPVSANSYNSSANLGNYLDRVNKGKIQCSTCHATHYADSNSSTFDNKSTANGFNQDDPAKGLKGQLQNSNGALLRTDAIGATATAINVCSSCHKETKNLNHNGGGQNIQCDHCHSAHVDYYAAGDPATPNINLVRRYFTNMSTQKIKIGATRKAIFNTATSSFVQAGGQGICQVCHSLPANHATYLSGSKKTTCLGCHTHANGFSGVDCASCHGQPPTTYTVGGPEGKASSSYQLDETFTPHNIHAGKGYYKYACKNCHYDGMKAGYHNVGASFSDVFIDTTGGVGDQSGLSKNVSTDYNATTKTCSSVYCHSNGRPRNISNGFDISWKSTETPSWIYGKNKIIGTTNECSTCHESGATLTTNAHYTHVTTMGLSCDICHNDTVKPNGALVMANHANGSKDVHIVKPGSYGSRYFTASFSSSNASCTNTCHGSSTPVWTDPSTAICGSCHAVPPSSNAHTAHFTATNGPKLGSTETICSSCHDNTISGWHANGEFNLKNCATCHPNGSSPIWSYPASVTCNSCHTGTASVVTNIYGTYTAPLKNLNATVGHGQYALATVCTACHTSTTDHIGTSSKRLVTAGNALCSTCHISSVMGIHSTARANMLTHGVSYAGAVNTFVNYTTTNDYRARDCAGCHDTHGTSNLASVRTVIAGVTIRPVTHATLSTALRVATPNVSGVYNGLCQVCHTKVKYFRRNAAPDLSHNGGKNCLDCHTHKGATFAFNYAVGGCGGCHGYPPTASMTGIGKYNNYTNAKIQDYAGGGGMHTIAGHIPLTAKASEGMSNCTDCHNINWNNDHNKGGTPAKQPSVNVIVDTKYKFNNMSAIKYNSQTCSNVSCHFKKSPNWQTGGP